MSKKKCTNTSCGMRNQSIETDRSTCVSCGRSLSNGFGDLFDSFFGNEFGGGGNSGKREIPAEVLEGLRAAETVLASFVSGTAVKRSELEAAHNSCLTALRRFG